MYNMSDLRQCSRQFLTEFIELYHSFSCLWQVKNEYSDRNKKSQAYDVMIEKFKEIDETANKETVTKKISSLHTVFKKERTKIIRSTKSGAGEDNIYKPTLWYFHLLEFLSDQDKIRKSTNTMDDELYEEDEQEETFQRAPETQAEHRFPARAAGIVEVPVGSRGPRSLYIRRNGDSFGFTLRHFIIYPPELLSDSDGRHEAVGALLTPMETIFVKNVADRGPAKQAGLQRGDRILCVNGVPVTQLTYGQVVQRIQSSPQFLHLLVVPKEEDVLQKYFSETAHNPLSNQGPTRDSSEERRRLFVQQQRATQAPREFQVDALSWRSLQHQNYHSLDYGRLAPRKPSAVQQQKSADNIYSSLKEFIPAQQKSAENIYSTPRDLIRPCERDLFETYAEPIINDSTQRPRAQPQVPLYRKMGRRASEGNGAVSLSTDDIEPTMTSSKTPYAHENYASLEMPGLNYPPGCRLSLDAGNRRESSSSLTSSLADGSKDSLISLDSSSTLTGQDDDSVVMSRLRKSLQEKEEFLKRPSNPPELKQREFYGRPKKLDKPVWPPSDPESSPSRLNKPTHHNFQRVKNDIETEREITQNQDSQPKAAKAGKDWQFSSNLGKIQETTVAPDSFQVNGTGSEAEDRRNYPPNIQMVSKRARQFETGQMMPEDDPILNDRTSFYRSELARLSEKRVVPNVAVRTREFETMNEPRRDNSSSSTSSAAVLRRSYRDSRSLDSSGSNCSISSCIAENTKQLLGNYSIPVGSKFIHCPLPSDYKPTPDLPNETQPNRMRARSNSAGSWVSAMQTDTSVDTNKRISDSTTRTGQESMDTTPINPPPQAPEHLPVIPEPVERLHTRQGANVPLLLPPTQKPQPPVRPNQLDLGAPKRPSRHLRPAQLTTDTSPPPPSQPNQPVCDDKPLVVRRTKNTNLTDEDRVMRRESYLKATEGGGMHLETGDFSDGDISPQVLRSGSVSGGSSSSVSLEREKNASSPCEKEKPQFVREGPLHCKITEIDGKRSTDRSWKQVWAVLRGPRLFFYKDRHHQSPVGASEVADQSLASGVDMRGSCVQVAEDYTKRKHVLRVSSVLPCRSELLLQADNTVDLAEWVQALQEQVASSTDVEAKLDQIGNNNKQQAVPQTVPATTSIQVPSNKSKQTSLRNRSPTGQSPVSKTRKPSQINDPSTSPKSKTWKGRVVKQFRKIQGASSPSSPTAPDGSTFGIPLEHCLPSINNQFVPRLVETCTEIVENRGLEIVGIYRVPGNNAAVTALTEEVNRAYDEVTQIDQRWNDVHVVSSLLKSFFRKMPDSLLTTAAYPLFIEANKIENPKTRMAEIKRLVKSLPPHHYNTLKHLILHLRNVVDHSSMNKMEARNLAIVFGPTIVSAVEDNMQKMVNDMNHQCKIVESLLLHAEWFFAEDDVGTLILPAPIATGEIFSNEPEVNRVLRDNINKVEGLSHVGGHKEKKELLQSLFSAAQRKYKRKTKGGASSNDSKEEPASPKGHKDFTEVFNNASNDLKESTSETKPNVIPTTITDMETVCEHNKLPFFNYKTGSEELKRRVENFIQETQSNLQRPRKPECSSNNSLELRLPNQLSSSSANNVRHSLPVNPNDQRVITKTHSASNVFSRNSNGDSRGRNAIGLMTAQSNKNYKVYYSSSDKQSATTNSIKDSISDVSTASSDFRFKNSASRPFGMRRGSSAENIGGSIEASANGNMKKIKYENENEPIHKTASLDSLNKLQSNLDDDGDLVSTITKIFDEKNKEMKPTLLATENIPYVDESPEKVSRQSVSYLNKENIPGSPKLYRNPSLHKNQYSSSKLLSAYKDSQKLKEKFEVAEKDEDSTLSISIPDNERHILTSDKVGKKVNVLSLSGNVKLKRSESLNKPERTVSPLNIKLKRSESLNKTSDKLKRSDSLTKNEKTECNISKKREISSGSRRTPKDFVKLKRKNGMPERSIKRRHTVGGTKDPDKVTLLDNRCQEEINSENDTNKEKNLRTSSPDLSSARRERLFFDVFEAVALKQQLIGARPQSFPESSVYKVPLESHV